MSLVAVNIDPYLCGVASCSSTIYIEATTIATALTQVMQQCPSLYVHLISNPNRNALIIVNDDTLLDTMDDLQLLTHDGDVVDLVYTIPQGEYGIVVAVMNIVWDAMPAVWASMPSWIETGINIAITVGLLVGMQLAIGALMGGVELPRINSGGLNGSSTYTFDGIKNTTAAGVSVPVVYGSTRVGGQVLAIWTAANSEDSFYVVSVNDMPATYLFMLVGLSEGEVEAVVDVEVNRLQSNMYAGVTTAPQVGYFTTGTSQQAVLPEFTKSYSTAFIGRKITQITNGLDDIEVTYDMTNAVPLYGYVKDDYSVVIGKNSCSVLTNSYTFY